jgi:hypothetical protein
VFRILSATDDKMVTGEMLTLTLSGGAPWGFRLQGGGSFPLEVAKVSAFFNLLFFSIFTIAEKCDIVILERFFFFFISFQYIAL